VAPLGVATILPVRKHTLTNEYHKAGTAVNHVNHKAVPPARQDINTIPKPYAAILQKDAP